MANVNNPHGLRPLMRSWGGGPLEAAKLLKAVGYAAALFRWDPVTQLAGYLNGPASGITPGTTYYRGVTLNPGAASTATEHQVIVNPWALFDVQEDNSGAANVVQAKMNYNANLTTTAGGTPTADNSNVALSGTSIAVTATLDVRITALLEAEDNALGAYARLEVRFNKHLDLAATPVTTT